MGRKKALSPEEFATMYLALRAERPQTTRQDDPWIADKMGISCRTLARYLKKDEYAAVVSRVDNKGVVKAGSRANKLIEEGYDLFEQGIREAKKGKDFGKARTLLIEALKICKAEADVNRVVMSYTKVEGDVNIGNKVSVDARGTVARELFTSDLRCPECGADVSPALLAKYAKDVGP